MYRCDICGISTNLKTNYKRHLNTKKHLRNLQLQEANKCVIITDPKMTQNDPKMTQNDPKSKFDPKISLKNDPKMTQNDPKSKKGINKKMFACQYCNKLFSTKAHMRRHEIHRCKFKTQHDLQVALDKEAKENIELHKKIDQLIEHNKLIMETTMNNNSNNITNNINTDNSTNIQQTNNIVIRNYGNEDLSHLTQNVMDKLIAAPGDMIKNLTKLIHFNKNKPENMNLYIPSKKQKHMKKFKDNEWVLEPKIPLIEDIVDRNYLILDTHFEEQGGSNRLSNENKHYYENYQKLMDQKDSKLMKSVREQCEYTILNNSEKVKDKLGLKY